MNKKSVLLSLQISVLYMAYISAAQPQYTVLLKKITEQSWKIINAESSKEREQEKKSLIAFIKEQGFDQQTRAKISYPLAIILRTTAENQELSKQAYAFFVALYEVELAQQKMRTVAKNIKRAVDKASPSKRHNVVDIALRKLQSLASETQQVIDKARVGMEKMMKASEVVVAEQLSYLKDILKYAENVVFAVTDDMRREGKSLIKARVLLSKKLDRDTKNAIASDIEIILNTTDENVKQSQQAYYRLSAMINLMSDQIEDLDKVLEPDTQPRSVQPIGFYEKIKRFFGDLTKSADAFMGRTLYKGATMLPMSDIERQDILIKRMLEILYNIDSTKIERHRLALQAEFESLLKDLDENFLEKLDFIKEKIANNKPFEQDEINQIINILKKYYRHFEYLPQIMAFAENIITTFSAEGIISEEDKKGIVDILNKKFLYKKIEDIIRPDIQTILNTSAETLNESVKALEHLKMIIAQQNTFSGNVGHSISSQPIRQGLQNVFLYGALLGAEYLIVKKLSFMYQTSVYNNEALEAKRKIYSGIVYETGKAYHDKDMQKYHTLMGILEGLGVEITEEWGIQNTPKGPKDKLERLEFSLPGSYKGVPYPKERGVFRYTDKWFE